jgi:GDPmannose 4,6-dehydratase
VAHDARYERPAEVDALRADASRARKELGWEAKTGFKELVGLMVDAEVARLEEKASGRLKMVTQRAEGH